MINPALYLKYSFIIFVFTPLLFLILCFFIPAKKERLLATLAWLGSVLTSIFLVFLIMLWSFYGFKPLLIYVTHVLPAETPVNFKIEFMMDTVNIFFLATGSVISLLIIYFSRYYMHREYGYKRFFSTILFFLFSYNLTVVSANFTTLFLGWEFLGIASFLLIAFYRTRYLPVRNANKIFSLYRIGDVGFLLAVWIFHHISKDSDNFLTLGSGAASGSGSEYSLAMFIFFLWAAMVKSAQFPFSYWIPRAMEGPTPSSAIFYGSLSIHLGVWLLLKTMPLWEGLWAARMLIFFIGLITVLTANPAALVQSSVKTQIAYSSVTQIGIMFMELALGLKWLVLIHFVGNAFLRTYQLLTSPSVASYKMFQQLYFYNLLKKKVDFAFLFSKKIRNSVFVMAQKEWNLDFFVTRYIFRNLKRVGKSFDFINLKTLFFIVLPFYALGFYFLLNSSSFPFLNRYLTPSLFFMVALILALRAYAERYSVLLILYLTLFSHLFVLLSISYNESYPFVLQVFYVSGILAGFLICRMVLFYMLRKEGSALVNTNKFYGHVYEHPLAGNFFLLGILCLIGFPITPTFIAEELILEHLHPDQFLLSFFFSLTYILIGINGIGTFSRIFLGPHCKHNHSVPIKSA